MERNGELTRIPEEVQIPVSVGIAADSFWESFKDACEYHEAHPRGVQNTVLWFGHQLVTLQEGEQFGLRDSMGFEKPVDLMDEKFAYEERTIGKSPTHTLNVEYPPGSRGLYMEYANNCHISLEELTARMHIAGLYVLQQLREEGVNLVKITNGQRNFWNLRVPHQKYSVRSRLERHYMSKQYRNDRRTGFQEYWDWPGVDDNMVE